MPSKQNIYIVPKTMTTQNEYFPSEVEDLVAAIKHNLQLKSRPCSKQKRMSPYAVPVRTLCRKTYDKANMTDHSFNDCKYCKLTSPVTNNSTDDPYAMLQELLREGSLIKEAVKRLQLGSNSTKSRKTNFYEIDDLDIRSPRLCEI